MMHQKILRSISIFIVLTSMSLGTLAQDSYKGIFYVSNTGNDKWSGTLPAPNAKSNDGPFATIEQARDAIRKLRSKKQLSKPVTVMIRSGTYFLDHTIVFDSKDSGTEKYPITYKAYPGEKPVISGGRQIDASWETHNEEIMVCTLPEVKKGNWFFRQLFVNNKRQTRARFPQKGYNLIKEAISDTAFRYKKGDFKRWQNLEDVEIVAYHSWNASRLRVAELNESKQIVRCKDANAPHPLTWRSDSRPLRYYVDNVLEGLQSPGNWYLEKHTGKLYYWPKGKIKDLKIIAPVVKQLLRFENVENIHLRGITFSDTGWDLPEKGYPDCGDVGDIVKPSAITFENVKNCSFEDNVIRNTGTYALEFTGSNNRIIGNKIYSTGSGGIISRNYDEKHNIISYNHIHHCGSVYPSAVGINIDDGGGIVAHNLVHHTGHSCVYGRHWATETQSIERANQEQSLIIEYNELHHPMMQVNDGAGIFIRDSNIIIRNNLIYDCYAPTLGLGSAGYGIYLGCETRSTHVYKNVVYNTQAGQLIWFKNRNNTLENNIFINGEETQLDYANPENLSHKNIQVTRNIFYNTNEDCELFRFKNKENSLPAVSDSNLFYCNRECMYCNLVIRDFFSPLDVNTFRDWQKQGFDTHSIIADPLFVDPENQNYNLKPQSPAFKLGFEPIDLSHVGLRGREP
jgi:hypothetical protein